MIYNQSIADINSRFEKFYNLHEVVSSGKRVNRPSDDPVDSGKILGYRSLISSIEQFQRNIDNGITMLRYTESSLSAADQIMKDAKVLSEQMATGSYSEEQRDMLVVQAEQLYDQLMKAGNTKIMDRYIFSGFKTDTKPFTRDNDYNISYHGDTGSIRVAVQQNVEVTVNTTGQQAFIDGTNCFDILKDLRKALSENDQAEIGVILERIDDAMNDISKERARVGTSLKEMESSKMILEEMNLGTTELLSNTEDADVVEAVTNLKEMEVAFEAALKSTDLITSLSLAKFM